MSTLLEKNKAVVTRFNKEFIEKGSLQAFEEIVAPDFVNRSAATIGIPGGREGIQQYIMDVLRVALTNIKVEIYEQVAEGDMVVTRKAITGTQIGEFMGTPGTGQQVTMDLIDMVKLKDGQYTAHWRYGQVISTQ